MAWEPFWAARTAREGKGENIIIEWEYRIIRHLALSTAVVITIITTVTTATETEGYVDPKDYKDEEPDEYKFKRWWFFTRVSKQDEDKSDKGEEQTLTK